MHPAPLSPVRRLRIIAFVALVCAAIVGYAATRHWWHDTSRLQGDALAAAIATAPDEASRACLIAGGVNINGTCASWDVTHPPTGLTAQAPNTIDAVGAAVVNTSAADTIGGLPAAAVFAIASFLLVVVAAALRSLFASVLAVLSGAQAYRSLSRLAEVINAPVEGLPMMGTTMWFNLFQVVTLLGTVVLAGGVLVWTVMDRAADRRRRIADGTYVSLRDRVQEIARAAMTSKATAGAAEPAKK